MRWTFYRIYLPSQESYQSIFRSDGASLKKLELLQHHQIAASGAGEAGWKPALWFTGNVWRFLVVNPQKKLAFHVGLLFLFLWGFAIEKNSVTWMNGKKVVMAGHKWPRSNDSRIGIRMIPPSNHGMLYRPSRLIFKSYRIQHWKTRGQRYQDLREFTLIGLICVANPIVIANPTPR